MTPYVIIPCSKEKSPFRGRPEDLYQGPMFKLSLAAAEALTDRWQIGVLSAKYGFVRLNQQIDPYDCTWGDPGCADAERLWNTADAIRWHLHPISKPVIKQEPVVLLLPRAYAERALRVWPDALWPLKGCRGIGEQRHVLAGLRDGTLTLDLEAA